MPTQPPDLGAETHRALGAGMYNRTWELMAIEGRTAEQDDELIDTAHASAWHWRRVGNAANEARGHWLCSRVYALLGRSEPALHHARRAVAIVEAGGEGFEDWDAAAVAESMARAFAVAGDASGVALWKSRARTALATVAEDDDRDVIEADLASIPD